MRRTMTLGEPLNLAATLRPLQHGRSGTTVVAGTEVWTATRTPEGPATMRIAQSGRSIDAEGWGPGGEHLLERLPGWLGVEDQPEQFDPPPGLIHDLHRQHPGLRFPRTCAVLEAMVPVIIAQKVAGKEAGRSFNRLMVDHGEPAPGPAGLRLQPSAEALAAMDYADLHPLGIERRRADTLRRVAARASRVEEAAAMDAPDAAARLMAFPGIGPWTAAKTAQVALGDADAVAIGDYHVPNLVAWNLAGEPRANDERMLELLEPYAGHRARAVRLLELSGRHAPKYGPRRRLRQIEAM
jgi:3-methyladenine DNA glycosylase/8-oxoguanine DNA glycosylase